MLFATVHFLLTEQPDHPLAAYYKSLTAAPLPYDGAFGHFKDFLLSNASKAIPLLESRITQTNEVSRCSYLLPSFAFVGRRQEGRPLALIDVGCSAGLHLIWDRYRYDYGKVQVSNGSRINSHPPARISSTPNAPAPKQVLFCVISGLTAVVGGLPVIMNVILSSCFNPLAE